MTYNYIVPEYIKEYVEFLGYNMEEYHIKLRPKEIGGYIDLIKKEADKPVEITCKLELTPTPHTDKRLNVTNTQESKMVKVGDKIRILFDGADNARVMCGDEFVVCEVFDDGCVRVDGEYNWAFYPCSYEVIHATPPQKITQNGYEYSLVGPVKPEWLVDGAWVVRKDNGYIHQVKETKSGIFHLTIDSEYSIRITHHIYGQYRPFTNSDWKWGMWAEYRGEKVFVCANSVLGVHASKKTDAYCFISYDELTPTTAP